MTYRLWVLSYARIDIIRDCKTYSGLLCRNGWRGDEEAVRIMASCHDAGGVRQDRDPLTAEALITM